MPGDIPAPPMTNGQASESGFKLGDFSIDEHKPIKVVCIGAGFSGIIAGIRFPQRIPNVELTIYDKNAGVGGTWFTNKYPGLACDIPAHCYQLTFEPKTDWSAFYAPGPEIRSYLQSVVDKYKLMRYIKLQHRVVHARYDEPSGKWHLRIRRPLDPRVSPASPPPPNAPPAQVGADEEGAYEEFEDTADLLFTGVGSLSRWKWPVIDGLKDFEGKLFHTADFEVGDGEQAWQEAIHDWKDKRVGVIGVGSSAIQIVPALQPRVKKIVNFVRGRTWIATPFSGAKMAELIKRDPDVENYVFTDEDKERFRDPEYYKQFRHELEADLNSVHPATIRDSDAQRAGRAAFHAHMKNKLTKKPWIADFLIPEFGVACRRLTAGPGYLESLCADNVDFQPTHIKHVTANGIELVDGTHEELDVLICATGYDYSFQLDFPIVGRGGATIQDKWAPHPSTYLAVCTDGFPNWFMSLGPNSGVGSGSLLALIERQVDYAVAAARKMQRERLKSVEVKKEAVADFDEYLEHYFPNTVYSEKCRSWYKMGKEEGRVVALWPGSCLHAVRALEHPRWEDFQYELPDGVKNRMHWLGDGQTYNEKTMTGDRAWYLNDDQVDFPPVPADELVQ
ncbi:FAD/NAD-binding domain-containing protein [Rhodofomes roseus]|uniref:FAD/NAD-binding domain-containing protein n=1 Tax=Rhodofomes roseus TaxID=34475 RepID=A0ABQ8K0J9_9APHY|nr:FAD/NAD-binding domain-containing protein [Rhodofomes roseus]KAH9830110.1 FAD/NAD-binding domain-containing protein [Rhodofomes roseus]